MLGNLRDFNFRLRDFDTLSKSIFSELFERGKKKEFNPFPYTCIYLTPF